MTYSSSNHFLESKVMLESVRNISKQPIIYYDVGLTDLEVAELRNGCNIQVVKFPFEKYPEHVKNLHTYAFKSIIMAVVLLVSGVHKTSSGSF